MIQPIVAKLAEGQDITFEEARASIEWILTGQSTPVLTAAFLTALRMKGEQADEIAGCAEAMRKAATRINLGVPVVADSCGTGGDKQGSFNVSTAAAFVAAGAGLVVAKHGNRSVSSQCGSADVLEALGVKVDPGTAVVEKCLRNIGIGFLFAPAFHPAMKHAMPIRRELGFRTVFNILGPICNPAGANAQVIGVFSPGFVDLIARVLVRLGVKESMVVHSNGHDEIVLSGETLAADVVNGKIKKRKLTPKDFGLKPVPLAALRGGTKEENAEIVRRVLGGEKGPQRDVVAANAAALLWVAGRLAGRGEVKNLKEGRVLAEKAIDSGAARNKLEQLVRLTQETI